MDRKTASRWHYAGTLLPAGRELDGVGRVEMRVVPELPVDLSRRLAHQTPINIHEYKPRYYRSATAADVVDCYVASSFVGRHTLAGWRLREQVAGAGPDVVSHVERAPAVQAYRRLAMDLLSSLDVRDAVLFAKHESFMTYLRKRELARMGVPARTVQRLVAELERMRYGLRPAVEQMSLYRSHLGRDLAETAYRLLPDEPVSAGSFFRGQSVVVDGRHLTVVNLPWGRDLASILAEAVLEAGARQLYVVGGVAYLGGDADLDDLFVPTSIDGSASVTQDMVAVAGSLAGPAGKRVAVGALQCVDSSFDNPPNFASTMSRHGVRALDMESGGFRQAVEDWGGTLSIISYIMDVPLRGVTLSETYYNESFLEALIASPSRGRDTCFEAVLRLLVSRRPGERSRA